MCVMKVKTITLLIVVTISVWVVDGSLVVYTENGALRGTEYTTVRGRTLTAFLGVPYAEPPEGELRFKEPRPVENWDKIRPANSFGSKCIQLGLHSVYPLRIQGEEDCLFLNIYIPKASNNLKLNVIFYIHGGAFMYGKGDNINPDFIYDNNYDVIFISLNYRLGPFGFLSTEDGVIPGNNGLKDQALALKWVQNNIERFGGDRSRVTIAGLSAGGASVHLHYLSPLSRDLFRQGIPMSGTALCPWVIAENSRMKAHMLANSVGCSTEHSKKLLQCLQKKDARLILSQVQSLFLLWDDNPFSPFGFVVETSSGTSPFLSKHPYEMLVEGIVKDAPWLTSATTEEGLFPAAYFLTKPEIMEELNNNWDKIAPHLLDFNHSVSEWKSSEISQSIRSYYFGEKEINLNNKNLLTKMVSDRLFLVDIERATRLQAASTTSPVYFYSFGYRGKHSYSEMMCRCQDNLGVSHIDDLMYVLNTGWFPTETDEDKAMVKTMVDIWQSFVESGDPSSHLDSSWTPVSPDALHKGNNMSYLLISSSTDIQLMSSHDLSNRVFWDEVPFLEQESSHAPHVQA